MMCNVVKPIITYNNSPNFWWSIHVTHFWWDWRYYLWLWLYHITDLFMEDNGSDRLAISALNRVCRHSLIGGLQLCTWNLLHVVCRNKKWRMATWCDMSSWLSMTFQTDPPHVNRPAIQPTLTLAIFLTSQAFAENIDQKWSEIVRLFILA